MTTPTPNEEQERALEILASGESLFLTGVAGTGKSFVTRTFLERFPDRAVAVTASTGIAALNIDGCTVHSWAGIGNGDTPIDLITRRDWWQNWIAPTIVRTETLLIDECFDYKQPILTEHGWFPIGNVVKHRRQLRVASRNPETGALEYKRIVGWLEKPAPASLLKINVGRSGSKRSGRVIRCTPEHKILTPSGYKRAGDLVPGDKLIVRGPGFTPVQRSVLVGSILGDGSCHRSSRCRSTTVSFMNGEKQRSYLEFKHAIFGAMASEIGVGESGYKPGAEVFRFSIGVTDETERLRDLLVDDGRHSSGKRRWRPVADFLDLIDAQALAVWFLDNGAVSRMADVQYAALHTERFSEAANLEIAAFISARFGLSSTLTPDGKGYTFLRFSKEMTTKLLEVIRPYVPSCMAWKVPGGDYVAPAQQVSDTCEAPIRSISVVRPRYGHVYDIEVEDYHNYVAGNVVVSNCGMLDARTLEMIDGACREARGSMRPFGGLQVVLIGDLAQLAPVQYEEHGYLFECDSWWDLAPRSVELKKVMRQADARFIGMLQEMRLGRPSPENLKYLRARLRAYDPVQKNAPRLVTHNAQADEINGARLRSLAGDEQVFVALESGKDADRAALERNCLSPGRLALKVDARVMFTKNDPAGRWVNGTLGRVVGFAEDKARKGQMVPVVHIDGEDEDAHHTLGRVAWKIKKHEDGVEKVVAQRNQFPVKLAWAATVHKCVHPDTLVESSRAEGVGLTRMADVADSGSIATAVGVRRYVDKVTNGVRAALKLVTSRGYEVTVTLDHRMPVGADSVFVEARRLRPGAAMRLVRGDPATGWGLCDVDAQHLPPAPERMNVRARRVALPRYLSSDAAEFFGLMVADGTVYRRGFRLAKRHSDVAARFATLTRALFGVEPKLYAANGAYHVEVNSAMAAEWLRALGGMAPHHKNVPPVVLSANTFMQCAFLRGLFEDGSVQMQLRKGVRSFSNIEWSTVSEEMARTVQVMLLRCGVVSTRRAVARVTRDVERTHWRLYIYGIDAVRFRERIGFVSAFKRERLTMASGHGTRWADKSAPLVYDPVVLDPLVRIEKTEAPSMCVRVPGAGRFVQNGFDGGNSQGLTLDMASCDLARAFAPGQTYVALSRCRTYEGLNLETWLSPNAVMVDPTVAAFLAGKYVPPREEAAS